MNLRATPIPQKWMEQLTKEDANSNSDSEPILTTWKEQLIKKDANGNTGSMPSRKTLDGSAQRRKAY